MVRASDIGSWTFCNRAWWLANVKKAPHENPAAFERGDSMHERHGRQVALAGMAQRIGLGLIGVALLLIIGLLLWSQL